MQPKTQPTVRVIFSKYFEIFYVSLRIIQYEDYPIFNIYINILKIKKIILYLI